MPCIAACQALPVALFQEAKAHCVWGGRAVTTHASASASAPRSVLNFVVNRHRCQFHIKDATGRPLPPLRPCSKTTRALPMSLLITCRRAVTACPPFRPAASCLRSWHTNPDSHRARTTCRSKIVLPTSNTHLRSFIISGTLSRPNKDHRHHHHHQE